MGLRQFVTDSPLPHSTIGCFASGANPFQHSVNVRPFEWEGDVDDDHHLQTVDRFWDVARALTSKITETVKREKVVPDDLLLLEHTYRLFPRQIRQTLASIDLENAKEYLDFGFSNRGACGFMNKKDGRKRKFELTETYYGCSAQFGTAFFLHFIVSVRGKLCWSMTYRDDVVTSAEAQVYARCIERVLNEIKMK